MSSQYQRRVRHVGEVLIRVPLLSSQSAERVNQELQELLFACDPEPRLTLAECSVETRRFLEAVVSESPSLSAAIARRLGGEPLSPKRTNRLRSSLDRYLFRTSGRPTPRGLLSGVALGQLGDHTRIEVDSLSNHISHAYPDPAWMLAIEREILSDPESAQDVLITLSPLAAVAGMSVFTPVHQRSDVKQQGGTPGSFRLTPFLSCIVQLTRRGIRLEDLLARLQERFTNLTSDRAYETLRELLARGVLISNILPPPDCDNATQYLLTKTRNPRIAAKVEDIERQLAALTSSDTRTRKGHRVPPEGSDLRIGDPSGAATIRVDMEVSLTAKSISRTVGETACEAAELYFRTGPGPSRQLHLVDLAIRFIERYGYPEEIVPVAELLDHRLGIGAPAGYLFPDLGGNVDNRAQDTDGMERSRRRDTVLTRLAAEAMAGRLEELSLSERDVASLEVDEEWREHLPPSFDFLCAVASDSAASIDSGQYRVVVPPYANGGVGAGRSLARFGHMLGEPLASTLASLATHDDASFPDYETVDLLWRPEHWMEGGLTQRPSFGRRVIAPGYMEQDLGPGVSVLSVHDIGATVRQGNWILVDLLTGRLIRPVAMTRFNHTLLPNLYRFLLEVGLGTYRSGGFDWGSAADLPCLPRLVHNKVVLSPRLWAFSMVDGKDAEADQFAENLNRFAVRFGMPQKVLEFEADNRVLVDLGNEQHIAYLAQRSAQLGLLRFMELLPDHSDQWAVGATGDRYLTELVFPLLTQPGSAGIHQDQVINFSRAHWDAGGRLKTFQAIEREVLPGDDCLYVRLTAPRDLHDEILAGRLGAMLLDLENESEQNGWFFIRYKEGLDHLRIRIFGDPAWLQGQVMPAIREVVLELHAAGIVSDFELDTYQRETTRYGGREALQACEELFRADSVFCLKLLMSGTKYRLSDLEELAVWSLSRLVRALGGERLSEMSEPPTDVKKLYQEKKMVYRALCSEHDTGHAVFISPELIEWEDARSTAARRCHATLSRIEVESGLTNSMENIRQSIAHMHVNRLFGIDREEERKYNYLMSRALNDNSRTLVPKNSE